MEAFPSVTVLLSSYNGSKYIAEQIKSILTQRGVAIQLVVRDDGSTDNTPEILRLLADENENISIFLNKNVGVIKSFFDLLENVKLKSDFYAFSDQDDVWYPDKLLNATLKFRMFSKENLVMYCSAIEYVDASLNHIGFSPIYNKEKIGFGNALVQNIATGCTIVVNEAARSKIISKIPNKCLMHDWWIYLVVSAFGNVIYDNRPSIKYRQHEGNVVGVALSFGDNIKRRFIRFLNYSDSTKTSTQVKEFNRIFENEINEKQKQTIGILLGFEKNKFSRIKFIFNKKYWRLRFIDQILLRLVILSGKF